MVESTEMSRPISPCGVGGGPDLPRRLRLPGLAPGLQLTRTARTGSGPYELKDVAGSVLFGLLDSGALNARRDRGERRNR